MSFLQPQQNKKASFANHFATISIILACYLLLGQIPLFVAYLNTGSLSPDIFKVLQNAYGFNTTLVLIMLPLIFALFGMIIAFKFILKWNILEVFTVRKKIDLNRILLGFIVWFSISFIILWIGFNDQITWNLNWGKFLPLLGLSILLIPLQCASEELFFRGYLMKLIGLQNNKPWHAILFTGTLFGLLHIANPEISALGSIALIYYIWTGFFLGILTILDKGLELPLGYHIANNLFAALIVTTDWQAFQTDALFIDKNPPAFTLEMMAYLLAGQAIFVFVFYRIYKWRGVV